MRWGLRGLTAVATFVLGAAVALFSVALHGYLWGLLVGLVATAATLVALPGGWARMPFGVGWGALVVAATEQRPEGDYVVARDLRGWVLLVAAVVVVIAAMVGARRHSHPPPVAPPSSDEPPSR